MNNDCFKFLILIFAIVFISCENDKKEEQYDDAWQNSVDNSENEEVDKEIGNDENSAVVDESDMTDYDVDEKTEIKEGCVNSSGAYYGLGGEGCSYMVNGGQQHREFYLSHECEPDCGDYDYAGNCYVSFKVKEIDQMSDNVRIKGICLDKEGMETDKEATLSYPKYNTDPLIPETLIGVEIRSLSISYPTGQFDALKTGRGELIFVHDGGLWDWEIVQDFIPNLNAEQKIIPTCESVCLMSPFYNNGKECNYEPCDEEPYYDYVYFPPIEFTFEGKEPVLVNMGDVVESEGCEYYVFSSRTVAPEDSDQQFYSNPDAEMPAGISSEMQFYIFNINALK